MAKKGLLGFFKGLSREIEDEEAKQRDYAMSKERDGDDTSSEYTSESREEAVPSVDQAVVDFSVEILQSIMDLCGYDAHVEVNRVNGDRLFIDIHSEADLGRIIGRDGGHLESLQTLLRAFLYRKYPTVPKLVLDAGGYRKKRRNGVRSKASDAARRVADTGETVALEPMNASERRMVHVMFEDDDQIETSSDGSGHRRHVVLSRRG